MTSEAPTAAVVACEELTETVVVGVLPDERIEVLVERVPESLAGGAEVVVEVEAVVALDADARSAVVPLAVRVVSVSLLPATEALVPVSRLPDAEVDPDAVEVEAAEAPSADRSAAAGALFAGGAAATRICWGVGMNRGGWPGSTSTVWPG